MDAAENAALVTPLSPPPAKKKGPRDGRGFSTIILQRSVQRNPVVAAGPNYYLPFCCSVSDGPAKLLGYRRNVGVGLEFKETCPARKTINNNKS